MTKLLLKELKAVYKDMPAYELPIGGYKLAAGWLVERQVGKDILMVIMGA